ncbi:hypothetical protein N478_15515 [Pseudoalteromonas luteoviolacea S4060-1]|uniref:Uncharacterized protein n=1 Tax=Pseudoalteromonas luteoviolacea S4060-1 TaxID=1365257 RepID=A0A167NPA3_9GAMM|nr:hypothetical protein N478_15515 [Pseudoalteromonas luteoviolacea S4060-1]
MKMIAKKQCRLILGGSGLLGPADPFSNDCGLQRNKRKHTKPVVKP